MAIAFYFDQNVSRVIVNGLRLHDIDILTAFEDGRAKWDDVALLDRAAQLSRVFLLMTVIFCVKPRAASVPVYILQALYLHRWKAHL